MRRAKLWRRGLVTSTSQDSATRDRIHRVAAELFARNGYHATGMSELSEAVHLGRGALYYHISSKESVLYAISIGAISQLLPPAQRVVAGDDSATDKVRNLARILMRNIAAFSNEWTVFFREHGALTGNRHDEVMEKREIYEQIWTRTLAEGVAAGEFVGVSSVATKGILGMFNYSYLWLRPDGELTPDEVAEQFCDILLKGLTPR